MRCSINYRCNEFCFLSIFNNCNYVFSVIKPPRCSKHGPASCRQWLHDKWNCRTDGFEGYQQMQPKVAKWKEMTNCYSPTSRSVPFYNYGVGRNYFRSSSLRKMPMEGGTLNNLLLPISASLLLTLQNLWWFFISEYSNLPIFFLRWGTGNKFPDKLISLQEQQKQPVGLYCMGFKFHFNLPLFLLFLVPISIIMPNCPAR